MFKPNWDEFRSHVISVINQYRNHMHAYKTVESCSKARDHKENADKLYNQLCGIRSTIMLLYPRQPLIEQLNGFILFAGESKTNHQEFINNIDSVILDLKKT